MLKLSKLKNRTPKSPILGNSLKSSLKVKNVFNNQIIMKNYKIKQNIPFPNNCNLMTHNTQRTFSQNNRTLKLNFLNKGNSTLVIKKKFCSTTKHPLGWSTDNKLGIQAPDINGSKIRATTVLCVRRNGCVVMMADGQVTAGDHIVKHSVKKLRNMADGKVIGGFAGSVSDAVTLSETLENKLEEYRGQLLRASVEMSKMWRTDKFLRKLEATIIVADKDNTLRISGDGNVFEHDDICAIGSGGLYAYSSALALLRETNLNAEQIAEKAMSIAGDICIYTNHSTTKLTLSPEEEKKFEGEKKTSEEEEKSDKEEKKSDKEEKKSDKEEKKSEEEEKKSEEEEKKSEEEEKKSEGEEKKSEEEEKKSEEEEKKSESRNNTKEKKKN